MSNLGSKQADAIGQFISAINRDSRSLCLNNCSVEMDLTTYWIIVLDWIKDYLSIYYSRPL